MSTQISKNFTLEEFYANSDTAKKYKIDNTPNATGKNSIINLVNNVLQPVRDDYGKPISVTCGYRCSKVNALVGGSKTSQHLLGQAADIKAVKTTNKELFDVIVKLIKSKKIKVGQLIWEFGNDKEPSWIHVSSPYTKTNQILKAKKVNGVTKYVTFNI